MDLNLGLYLTAFFVGALHAIEVDHMVAVSVFAGLKPKVKTAARYGARWGLGHAAMVVLVGALIALAQISISESWLSVGEAVVGVALIGLGLWALRAGKQIHIHAPAEHDDSSRSAHGHVHTHGAEEDDHRHHHHSKVNDNSRHQHFPTMMGALHGLVGSAPIVALVPIALVTSFSQALIYLLVFSIGTTLAMTVYAALAAAAIGRLSLGSGRIRYLTYGISAITMVVGCYWIARATL